MAVGRVTGVYNTFEECNAQTLGYRGAVSKGFNTHHEAKAFCAKAKPIVIPAASGGSKSGLVPGAASAKFAKPSSSKSSSPVVDRGSIEHDMNHAELVQHYTSYHRMWNEEATNSKAELISLDKQRTEIARRLKLATYYANNSAGLAHYHLAWSLGGDTKELGVRPPFPPMPPQMKASIATSATASSGSNQGTKRSRGDDVDVASGQWKKAKTLNRQSPTSDFVLEITIRFDWCSCGNPGLAGAGAEVMVIDSSTDAIVTTTYSIREFCGENVFVNFAEYRGLLAGLRHAKSYIEQWILMQSASFVGVGSRPLPRVSIYGNSIYIIQQLQGARQCKHPDIVPLFQQCQRLIEEINQCGKWQNSTGSVFEFQHNCRAENKVAGALAKEAMDQRDSWITSSSQLSKQEMICVVDNESHHSC